MPLIQSNSLNWLRMICAVAVILAHLPNPRIPQQIIEPYILLKSLIPWSTLGFCAIAGWLHAYTNRKSEKPVIEYISNRLQRLVVPLLLVTLLYSVMWQIVQSLNGIELNSPLPLSFWGKIKCGLWPALNPHWAVGLQLYFIHVIFIVGVAFHCFNKIPPLRGPIQQLTLIGLLISLNLTQKGSTVGCSLSYNGFLCSAIFYTSGYILFAPGRAKKAVLFILLLAWLSIKGVDQLLFITPLVLIALSSYCTVPRNRIVEKVAGASGTIYLYHAPFILTPGLIAISHIPNPSIQQLMIPILIVSTISGLTLAHFLLKKKNLRYALL